MKIAIIANSSKGLWGFREDLIQELLRNNAVIAITPNNGLWDELLNIGCKMINVPVDRRGVNPLKDINIFWKYREILKREKPDLVITYTIKPNVYGGFACRMLKIPYAANITGLGTAFENGGLLKKIANIMYNVACKKAKVVFFENEENRQIFIKERIVKESQTYRLNGAGVNLDKYQVAEYPEGEKIKFLFMGRVMAEKGIDELLEAMNKLINEGINCDLDVIGGYEEEYNEKIEKYESEGWFHYHGYQKDVRPFIEKCHCFVLPSWHEGMSNANLECAASGRPVITSSIPGCMEAVVDGVSGFLAERKNADDLYRVMKKLTELSYEERKAMGLAGRKHMEEVFDKKKVVEDTIQKLDV